MKVTAYFEAIRKRPDRTIIRDEWIERAVTTRLREQVQLDGRIRRWTAVPEMAGRYLRVIVLPDGEPFTTRFSIAGTSHEDPVLF